MPKTPASVLATIGDSCGSVSEIAPVTRVLLGSFAWVAGFFKAVVHRSSRKKETGVRRFDLWDAVGGSLLIICELVIALLWLATSWFASIRAFWRKLVELFHLL